MKYTRDFTAVWKSFLNKFTISIIFHTQLKHSMITNFKISSSGKGFGSSVWGYEEHIWTFWVKANFMNSVISEKVKKIECNVCSKKFRSSNIMQLHNYNVPIVRRKYFLTKIENFPAENRSYKSTAHSFLLPLWL